LFGQTCSNGHAIERRRRAGSSVEAVAGWEGEECGMTAIKAPRRNDREGKTDA